MENDQPGNYICRFCKGSFTQAEHLHKHVQLIHAANPSTKSNRTCPICGTVFANYDGYTTHLRHIHGQRNEGQIFAFKCFNDFFLWKTELEGRSTCKFSLHAAPKLLPSNEKIHVYQCDGNGSKRKKGSCSTLDNCAAMICATESLKNHEIKVEYWNTHVGHSVPVEDDELNAAINSVQASEEPEMHVMDMLNCIDQSIETGAEVFVTETIEEEHSLSPLPKKNQKNIFNIKKTKPSSITSTKTPPIVQNFSFKKDPSKKKESSIYSLASVACGKISANKAVKSTEKNISKLFQNSLKTNIQKGIKSNAVCELKKIVNSICELAHEDSCDPLDHIPKSSLQDTSIDDQIVSQNASPLVTNKKQVVYNWPLGKPLPSDWVFTDPPPSKEKSSKKSTEKENISSISNEIIVPLGSEITKSKVEKALKPKISKDDVPSSNIKSKSKQSSNVSASIAATKNASAHPAISLSTTSSTVTPHIITQIIPSVSTTPSTVPPQILTQLVPSVFPATQTYLSVNNKLIPVMNAPSVLPPSLNSNVLLPILPGSPTESLLKNSLPKSGMSTSKGIAASHQPQAVGGIKQSTIAPFAGTIPTLSNSFAGSQVILLPCTNNSAIPSVLHPFSSTALAPPLIFQSMPPTSTPVDRSNMFMTSLLKTVTTPSTQQNASSVSLTHSPLTGLFPVPQSLPTDLSTGVKVQKVSLPSVSNSVCATSLENKNVNSVLTFSQPSQVSSVVLNTSPISSTPAINIPETSKSDGQKPGTFVFESSGDLYMLEPLDDDLVFKEGNIRLTSTPKKLPNSSKFESLKKKQSPKKTTNESILLQRPELGTSQNASSKIAIDLSKNSKFSEIAKTLSTTIGAARKKSHFSESNNYFSSEEELESSILKNLNGAIINSDLTKSVKDNTISTQKTEMTIKITPSQNLGEKEVSIFAKTTPLDIRTKLPPSGSSPSKYTSSLLTVKTVPSFSLHQSKPVTSSLNSYKNLTSSSLATSSAFNNASSAFQCISSTSLQSCEKEVKSSSGNERLEHETCPSTQNVEVKRNVTIKSVVQEKRFAADDDIEVMKKVKFYKLEMKYLACQEQCKKLKIELAKAVSKNKELLQDIEEKKEKNELEQSNSKIRSELIDGKENSNTVESQKVAFDEKTESPDAQQEKLTNDKIQEETAGDVKRTTPLDILDSDMNDLGNEMDTDFDMLSNGQSDKLVENDQVLKNSPHTAGEECTKDHVDSELQQEMDVDEDRKESTDCKEACTFEASGDFQINEKDYKEAKTNSNIDVFTMVRASVLKNLYLSIEDLTEENKMLHKDLEEYRKLDLSNVPSFEESDDSL